MTQHIRHIFCLRREERTVAAILLIIIVALNALVIAHYYDLFTQPARFYWPLFIHNFHISGFDPITYSVVSDWTAGYNVYRHPLLAFYMYIPYLINQALMQITGINCAMFVVASMQTFCAFYSFVFLRRIMRDIIGLDNRRSDMLILFFFSFAYIMLSAIVPDHFIVSMMLLLYTLHHVATLMKSKRRMSACHTVALFTLTAGTSLNNGLKIFMASLFANGRRFFKPKHIILAVILPSALMWYAGKLSYKYIVWPRDMARNEAKAKQKAERQKKERQKKTAQAKAIAAGTTTADSTTATAAKPRKKTVKRALQGRPISNGEFMRWTDITTSRTQSVVENLFGESIQLHEKHLLEDQFRKRPMIVSYSHSWKYAVELAVVIIFAIGVWCGRRSRFLWLVMSWFALDMILHVALGFAINEIYIMTAHWAFAIPIAAAYALASLPRRGSAAMTLAVAAVTVYLLTYNISLIAKYLC